MTLRQGRKVNMTDPLLWRSIEDSTKSKHLNISQQGRVVYRGSSGECRAEYLVQSFQFQLIISFIINFTINPIIRLSSRTS